MKDFNGLVAKKSVLLPTVRPKGIETTLAILSKNEFKYRKLGAYKLIARPEEGAHPRLGLQKGLPKASFWRATPAEESGGPGHC